MKRGDTFTVQTKDGPILVTALPMRYDSFGEARKAREIVSAAGVPAVMQMIGGDVAVFAPVEFWERFANVAERDRIKAYNASCRKGLPDSSLLDEKQRANLTATIECTPYFLGKGGAFPAYALTNLGGNINRNRKRLAQLERAGEAA